MAHWFESLTWSQAALLAIGLGWLLLIGFLIICAIAAACGFNDRPVYPRRRMATPRRRRGEADAAMTRKNNPWPVTDYTPQYSEKTEWLGEKHLLARPVKRRSVEADHVPTVLQFQKRRR